nr:putative RNA-directed DNA polymerase [Tanacetum cinerariifolium]
MKMEQYLAHTDYALWEVILNGNSVVQMTKDEADEHLARFHGIKDAKTLWAAIKTRFGEGLDKGYDRFQRLLSLLEIHEADNLDIDDLYNNLKVYEADIKSSSGSSSNSQNVAFVSAESTCINNELNAAYCVSTATGYSSQAQDNKDLEQIDQDDLEEIDLKLQVECYKYHRRGHFARDCRSARNSRNRSRDTKNVGYEGRDNDKRHVKEEDENALVVQERLGTYDWSYQVEEEAIDFALMAFTSNPSSSSRSNFEVQSCSKQCVQSYEQLKTLFDEQREKLSKANIEIIGYQYGLESIEGQLRVHQQNEVIYEEKIAVLEYEVKDKSNLLKYTQKQLDEALREKEDLKAKFENFETSLENLTKLLDSQISAKVKTGLGYDSQFHEKEVLDIREEEMTETVFDNFSSDEENSLANDRFKKGEGYHAVPPSLTGNYIPPKPDLSFVRLDDFIYKFKISETVTSLAKDGKDAPETSTASIEKPKEDGSGRIPVCATKPKAVASTSAAKPVNTVRTKQNVNFSKSRSTFHKSHSPTRRVTTVKTSACCVWRPRVNDKDQLSKDNRWICTRVDYCHPQQALKNKGIVESGCSRHMKVNKAYLNDYREINDGGFVAFGSRREFKNRDLDEFCGMKGIKRESSNSRTLQQNGVVERKNMTLIEVARTMPADSLLPITFWAKAINTAYYVFNRALVTKSHNKTPYELLNGKEMFDQHYIVLPLWSSVSSTFKSSDDKATNDKPTDDTGSKTVEEPVNKEDQAYRDELDRLMSQEKEAINAASTSKTFSDAGPSSHHPDTFIPANTLLHVDQDDSYLIWRTLLNSKYCLIPTHRVNLDHPKDQILGDPKLAVQTKGMAKKSSGAHALISYIHKQRRTNHKDYDNCLFACFISQMKPKKVWRLVDLPYGKKAIGTKWVYRNKKDEKGIVVRNKVRLVAQEHKQEEGIDYDEVFAPVARIEAIRIFLAFASYMRFIVYQMDIHSSQIRSTRWRRLSMVYTKILEPGLQVKQSEEGIFISQDKFQVTPKLTHLHDVKRIFRYLKGQPKLGLWYPRYSLFDLEAYSNNDYARANLDRKSITGGCQFLGRRFISWQCKKQTIVTTFTTKAEYVAAANCYGQGNYGDKLVSTVGFSLYYLAQLSAARQKVSAARRKSFSSINLYMADLKFVDQHNMVACLERTKNTTTSKKVNLVKQILAIVDGKFVVISKSSVRSDLLFNDEDEVNTSRSGEDYMEHQDDLTDVVPLTPHDSPFSRGHTPRSDEEEAKTTQDKVITILKLRVRRLEKKRNERTSQPMKRRLFKGRVETSTEKCLCKDASKQGRNDDKTEELNLTDGDDTEVLVEEKSSGEKSSSTADQTLIKLRSEKVKEKGVAFRDVEEPPRLTRSTTTLQPLLTIDPKDKGKGVLVEEEPEKLEKVKKRDQGLAQIESDVELA